MVAILFGGHSFFTQTEADFLNELTPTCADDCVKLNWVFRLLVFAQVVLVALLLFTARPTDHQWYVGLVKMVGVALGLWAIITMGRFINISPRLKENAPLRRNGPYRFVRHPMYSALLVFCSGHVLGDLKAYTVSILIALLFVLALKIYYEERILRKRFSDYQVYARETKRLIPFLF